jgi:hypothetical protein
MNLILIDVYFLVVSSDRALATVATARKLQLEGDRGIEMALMSVARHSPSFEQILGFSSYFSIQRAKRDR